MKKILPIIALASAVLTIFFSSPSFAGDAVSGSKVFKAVCAACHLGGGNVVSPSKNLKKEALDKYEMRSLEKIMSQVRNGKGAMPAFGKRLDDKQIEDVATYVLEQAEKGW